jgi:hypothetical protein
MWSLKPYDSPPSTCPGCELDNEGFENYRFTGLHILGIGRCNHCGTEYFHNWPVGHGVDFPISFDGNGKARYPAKSAQWLAGPLIKSIKEGLNSTAKVVRKINRPLSAALLLNCLDPCYGHVLWKLFNAFHYRDLIYPKGLIVLIPANCTWLVPDFVAEVWSVDIPMSQLGLPISELDGFIRSQSEQYDSIRVLPGYTHIDHEKLDLKMFLGVDKFKLSEFDSRQAAITFIWREDRFWLGSVMGEWISLIEAKYSWRWLNQWLLKGQLRKMRQVAIMVRKQLPEARFFVTGLGRWGKFPDFFEDLRQEKSDRRTETKWCQVYAQSQLVIGVHGSNMMIPTALAAGFIELLPRHKLSYMSEDILMNHPARLQTFLGRHLDLYCKSKVIAVHAVSMIRDFGYLYKNWLAKS